MHASGLVGAGRAHCPSAELLGSSAFLGIFVHRREPAYGWAAMEMDSVAIQSVLPHRYPFLFIDRVVAIVPGESLHAQKLVSNSDPILQGHFPGMPILPGVVQIEMMAQAAILLAHASDAFDPETQVAFLAGVKDSKFRAPCVPGDVLGVHVQAQRIGKIGKFSAEVRCGDAVRSSATITALIGER